MQEIPTDRLAGSTNTHGKTGTREKFHDDKNPQELRGEFGFNHISVAAFELSIC